MLPNAQALRRTGERLLRRLWQLVIDAAQLVEPKLSSELANAHQVPLCAKRTPSQSSAWCSACVLGSSDWPITRGTRGVPASASLLRAGGAIESQSWTRRRPRLPWVALT